MFTPFTIRVPASTANLGPGFDSIGLALSLYLTVDVEPADQWLVEGISEELKSLPQDDTHYIVQVAKRVAARFGRSLRPAHLRVTSEIPLARGLGSSASAIVAGIVLAERLGDFELTTEERVHQASLEEGHPDNAGASVTGGLVVGEHSNEGTPLLTFDLPDVKVVVVIPHYELLTSVSRAALPKSFAYAEGVKASAIANVFLASLLSGEYELAGQMMMRDRFHQSYRRHLVPLLSACEDVAMKDGAFGVALSGAGPTVACYVREENTENVMNVLTEHFSDCTVKCLSVDEVGVVVNNRSMQENLAKQLTAVETDRANGKCGCSVEELDEYLSQVIEETK